MIYLFDIAYQTFTLEEFMTPSMVVKELVAAQVRQLQCIKKEILENVFDGIVKRLKFCIDMNGDTFGWYM